MAPYWETGLDGTLGVITVPADVDMETVVGAPEFVAGGWKDLDSCVEFDAAGSPVYFARTDSYFDLTFGKCTFKFFGAPTAECSIIQLVNTAPAVVVSVRMDTAGHLILRGPNAPDVATSVGTYSGSEWVRLVWEVNQQAGRRRVRLRIYDNGRAWLETISCDIGGTALAEFRVGAITTGVTWRFRAAGPAIFSATRQYIEQEQDSSVWRDSIVYGMYDDASPNVNMQHCEQALELAAAGYTFENNFLATPLCSPCRASIYTGQFPQNNGVFGNSGQSDWDANPTNADIAYWRRLSDAGYIVAQLGKHLNGASENDETPLGMDVALITDSGTHQFDYQYRWDWFGDVEIVDTTDTAQAREDEYLTDVMRGYVAEFLAYMAQFPGLPFVLYLAPYVTHSGLGADPESDDASQGSPPAPRDRPDSVDRPGYWSDPDFPDDGDLGPGSPEIGDIDWPDHYWPEQATNWRTRPVPTPGWYQPDPLSDPTIVEYKKNHLNRIRAAQSFDPDLIEAVRADLGTYDLADRTWIMLTSDNGFHLGEHDFPQGKGSVYDHDTRMPLIVYPPGGLDAPVTISAIIQPVDLLPTWMEIAGMPADLTLIDGRSWLGFVTGDTPTEWRQTALIQYGKPDEDTWEAHLGTGDPAPWTALRTVRETLVSYDRGNPGNVPTDDLGEAYDNATDPGQIVNIFGITASYRLIPAFNQMGAYYNGLGETSWEQALLPFSLTTGDPEDGPFWVIGGTDMTDAADRFYTLLDGTRRPSVPGLVSSRLDDTEDEDDPGYDTSTPHGRATMVLNQRVTDRDENGEHGGAGLFDINKVALESIVTPPGRRFPVGMRPTRTSGVEWESTGKTIGALEYEDAGAPNTEDVKIPIQLTRPFRSLVVTNWAVPFRGNIGVQHVTSLAGGSAPVRGALIKIRGPIKNLEHLTDYASGWDMSWNGWDLGSVEVTESPQQWLLIDTRNWIARLKTTNDWDLTTGTSVGAYLRATGGQPDLLRLYHVEFEGDPRDRRYFITAEGTGRNNNTELAIQSYRWRY